MEDNKIKEEVQEMLNKSVEEKTTEINKSIEEKTKTIEKSIEEKTAETEKKITEAEVKIKSLETETETLKKDLEEKTETIKELGKSLKENIVEKERKDTYYDIIYKSVIENADKIKSLNGTEQGFKVEKAAGDIVRGNLTASGGGIPVSLQEVEAGVTRIAQGTPFMREIMRMRGLTTKYATWIEQDIAEGSAGTVAEGATKPKKEIKWVERSAEAKKIAVTARMSQEALEDIEWAAMEVAEQLSEDVLLKENQQLLVGDGTGNNYKGIVSYAPAFNITTGRFFHAIQSAAERDVLRVAIALIVKNHFNPTTVILNPTDAALIDMHKDDVSSYVDTTFTRSISEILKNLIVIEDEAMPEGQFLVGDFTKANYRLRKEINIEFMIAGKEDFNDNFVSVRAELRGVPYVKNNEVNAFIKGTFATAIPMINKV